MITTKEKTRKKDGEGSIYQLPNGSWVGKLQYGKKPDGKPNRKTFSGKTEAEVRKKIKEFNKNKDKYAQDKVGSISLEEYINKWLYTYKQNDLKPLSFDRLESTIKHHIIPNLGYLQISLITIDDIQKLINNLYSKKLSHSTIKKVYDALNACFKFAIVRRDIEFNPVLGVKMPSVHQFDKKEIRFFSDEELKIFKEEAIRQYKTGRFVYTYGQALILMLNTGIREGELVGIDKTKDIDLENNTLHIRRNIATVKTRDNKDISLVTGYENKLQDSTKTYSGDRIIPLNNSAKNAILSLIKTCNYGSNQLLSTSDGNVIAPSYINKTLDKILTACGIEKCGTHTLRHTFASKLFENGVDVKVVSELLGHSNVTITYNTYIHLIKKQKVKAIELIKDL